MPKSQKSSRLPKRFPVGTTYVVEGRGGESGKLLVSSRYVVLPGGQRVDIAAQSRPSVALAEVSYLCKRSNERTFARSNVAK